MMDQWTNAEDLLTGYQPPIEIIMGQVRMEQDKEIYRAVQSYGVNVDKDELIRALQYDRGQYEKGYADGLRHRETEWISVDERLPEEDEAMRYFNFGNVIVVTVLAVCNKTIQLKNRVFDGENWEWSPQTNYFEEVTHWMPLPEPPEGE